ncbi:MAG: hypothetical protein PHY43_10255 [Verrucomicrobiales bacterium]|nr:hypothetical protein [Verrucomicrobiales bacterium]
MSEIEKSFSLDHLKLVTDTDSAAAERRGAPPATALPCLSSNNCTKKEKDKLNILTGANKRTAFMVAFEIQCLANEFGIERLGFFTLTFKDHITNLREAQRRFRSLRAHVIVKRYRRAIGVWERHASGRIHFHLVVVLDKDIQTGADFAAFKRKDYRSANSALRAEWAFWRETCPKYRFGRHELMPVKSNAEGIARYVGKYISKHVTQRLPEDKGARVVRFIGYKPGMRRACCRFSWNTDNGWLWRHKTAMFAGRHGLTSIEQMKKFFGRRWAYHLQKRIIGEYLEGVVFPSRKAADINLTQAFPTFLERVRKKEIQDAIAVLESLVVHPSNIDN